MDRVHCDSSKTCQWPSRVESVLSAAFNLLLKLFCSTQLLCAIPHGTILHQILKPQSSIKLTFFHLRRNSLETGGLVLSFHSPGKREADPHTQTSTFTVCNIKAAGGWNLFLRSFYDPESISNLHCPSWKHRVYAGLKRMGFMVPP